MEITLDKFPIKKLSNLKELVIIGGRVGIDSEAEEGEESEYWNRGNISKYVIRNIPKSVKDLTLNGFDIEQKHVDELTALTQLEKLTLGNLALGELKLNFDGFKKLNKVTELKVFEENNKGVNKKVFKIITKFPSVKKLALATSLYPLESFDRETISVLKDAKSLEILKLYMSEKRAKKLQNDICSLTNVKKVTNDEEHVYYECSSSSSSPSPSKIKISTNGKCGKEDGKCPNGKCCSQYGWCGTSKNHCGTGCQSEFGECNTSSNTKTTVTKTKTSTRISLPTTTNGKCGEKYGRCPEGECCSRYGYCGRSSEHCYVSKGCQSEFGKCKN